MCREDVLLTTGYAGHDPMSFLAKLREHDVKVVVDVRQNPVSRKKGFSRSRLSAFLAAHDVQYVHESELGVPISLRRKLKSKEENLDRYFVGFRDYLAGCGAALDRVYELAIQKRCCLVCVEHLATECHRSIVAELVEARNGHALKVVHV
ncbi:MAG: DUF488 domain-containing protein [Sedimentisphaerales bacterium]|nr:DUF488 domain-containing protein [Sedimentisphaerales bacterium]